VAQKNEGFVNDLYDGKQSLKLENGAVGDHFSSHTVDHYEQDFQDAKNAKAPA